MKRRRAPTEVEVDDQVIADADVDDAWTKGVKVGGKAGQVSLPAALARRAQFG